LIGNSPHQATASRCSFGSHSLDFAGPNFIPEEIPIPSSLHLAAELHCRPLTEAKERGLFVISMKDDWKRIFGWEKQRPEAGLFQ
jgi:hypothetical protein